MQFLRSNTAVIITVGPFFDRTDGVTIEIALTITNERITLTADTDAGSAPTNILDNVTGATSGTNNDLNYITGNDAGMMQLELTAADTNRVGRMLLSITDAANHVPVFMELFVLPQAIFDWFTGVIVPLPANVTTWLGTAAATPTVAGVPEVDVTHLGGAAQSATDLKDFADDGYDPATNKVQGLVLADAVTTVNGLAAGVITAAAIATGAVDADALATDAVAEIADGVWDEAIAGHLAAGSTGLALNSAGSAGDPWNTALPGAYGAGTAGNIVGTNLNATVSSRATQTSVDTIDDFLDTEIAAILAAVDTEVAAIKAKTDNLPTDPADESNVLAAIAAVQADTDNIQTRIPAALVSGRIDASVGAMATDVLTNTALAASAVTEIQAGLATPTNITAGTITTVSGNVNGSVGSVTGLTPATIAAGWIAAVIEGAHTLGDFMRLFAGVLTGKSSGGGTATVVFRDVGDTKNRISATVDASGNRTAVGTRDGT